MANALTVKTPRMAHELAYAMVWDAVSAAQRARMAKGSKAKRVDGLTPLRMTRADSNLFAETVQRWYKNFNILSATQWMPEGYEWVMGKDGNMVPMSKQVAKAA